MAASTDPLRATELLVNLRFPGGLMRIRIILLACQEKTMSRYKTFRIAIPTDAEGFVGRACDAPDCRQYFKIYVPDHGDYLYCPYCGVQFSRNKLFTSQQLKYAKKAAIEEVRVYVIDEFQKMMKNAFRGSKHVTYKPGSPPHKRPVRSHYPWLKYED
jgi:hypothetical protein